MMDFPIDAIERDATRATLASMADEFDGRAWLGVRAPAHTV